MSSHLERIADLLPADKREAWARLAARFKAATRDTEDEIFLLAELIAFSGLISRDGHEKMAVLLEEFKNNLKKEGELISGSSNPQLAGELAAKLKEQVPSYRDLKNLLEDQRQVSNRLTGYFENKGKDTVPASPAGVQSRSSLFLGALTGLLISIVVVGGFGFGISRFYQSRYEDLSRQVRASVPDAEMLVADVAASGGLVKTWQGQDEKLKRNVKAVVVGGGQIRIVRAFKDEQGRGVILFEP